MPRYAKETTVPVERSRAEIEETLRRYGADEFHSGWKADAAMIAFRIQGLFIRFILPIPSKKEKRFTHKEDRYGYFKSLTEQQAHNAHEQEIRQRWRALLLTVKAKLEAVECGISTVEQEFLAFIVMQNDMSVGEWIAKEALPAIKAGGMPQVGFRPEPEPIRDAEFSETKP